MSHLELPSAGAFDDPWPCRDEVADPCSDPGHDTPFWRVDKSGGQDVTTRLRCIGTYEDFPTYTADLPRMLPDTVVYLASGW